MSENAPQDANDGEADDKAQHSGAGRFAAVAEDAFNEVGAAVQGGGLGLGDGVGRHGGLLLSGWKVRSLLALILRNGLGLGVCVHGEWDVIAMDEHVEPGAGGIPIRVLEYGRCG